MQPIDIDYIGVLDYLSNNQEIPYSNPDADGIDVNTKNNLLAIKRRGQNAVAEMKKMADRCEALFGLDKCLPGSWLDGSNTKTRKYLWTQMKYKAYEDNPISISLFVEKNDGVARYRISLEIKNDGADKNIMAKYHSHLDMPKTADMVYVSGSNEWGNPLPIDGTADEIKTKIKNNSLRKVQLCIYVELSEGKTNEEYDAEIMNGVKKLIPFYEHVIGKTDSKATIGRAWLLTWNPDSWEWPNYKKWCADTKKGVTHIEPWTCSSKQPAVGDELFLTKTGSEPRGILAHGTVVKASYDAPHYDSEKAAQGIMSNHIDAQFDWIQDYETEPMLVQDDLKEKFPEQQWSPYGSGIEIKSEVFPELKKLWNELTGQNSDLSRIELSKGGDGEVREQFDKNMILYGPPGTGKTYNSAIYAVAICDGKSVEELTDYSAVMKRYDELKQEKRIAFTTFHQSYGYEEFIEGIKPVVDSDCSDIGYKIESGIFKKFCEKAAEKKYVSNDIDSIKENPTVWKVSLEGAGDTKTKRECFEAGNIRIGWSNRDRIINDASECNSAKERTILTDFEFSMDIGDLVVTLRDQYSIDAIGVITGEYEWLEDGGEYPRSRKVTWLAKNINEDIRTLNNGKSLTSSTVYRLNVNAEEIIAIAKKNSPSLGITVEENEQNYVFIIDEINRGNISKIFGELITLIENTKRAGMPEAASATLPYSSTSFSVPSNVYILGTMNTADRSIALMDTALRRRFQFVEMMPDADVLRDIGADRVNDLDVAKMLETINERITFLYDREHTIGHAFFTGLAEHPDMMTLQTIFEKNIIPLLQEYFYEDYQKIQLVLGDNGKTDPNTKFILDEEVKVKNIFKGNADDVVDLPEKKYTINKKAFSNIESYKQIM